MAPVLEAADVRYRRGGRTLLDGISLHVVAGETLAVLGPSGSGKSSLLAVLGGLEPPDSGFVRLVGEALAVGDVGQRHQLGLVLQGYGLLALLTAAENVEVALQARGVTGAAARTAALRALSALQVADIADKLLEQLSGGQQQRVAVARALVTTPQAILADEPTAELDADAQDVVIGALLAAAGAGAAVVIATHDPQIADRCSRQVRISGGRLHAV